MKSRLILFILILSSLGAIAQKVTFKASAPLIVEGGERFRVEFRLEGAQNGTFVGPAFNGCKVLDGPTIARGSSVTIINGVQNNSSSEMYTYVLEASASASQIAITPASISVDGKSYSTKAVKIDIMGSGSSGAAQSGNQPTARGGKVASDDVLIRMSLSKTNVYKGEPIVATLKLYVRDIGISSLSNPKYPTFNGFWTQELDLSNTGSMGRETLSGKVYNVQPLRQWLLYPQRSGTLEVEQSSMEAILQVVIQGSSGNSFFDNFMGGGSQVQNIDKVLNAPSLKVQVKELPSKGAPADFAMAVGQFTMKSELSSPRITANNAGSVKITLSGTGDFPMIEAPTFKLPAAFEQYDTKSSESIRNTSGGAVGSRTWEFPFIARAEGEYTLPQIAMSYFDPNTGTYKTLSSPEYKLTVERDPTGGKNSAAVMAGMNKEDLKVVGSDIRYIKRGDLNLRGKDSTMLFSTTYFIALAVILLLFFASIFLLKKQIALRADVASRKHRKASKVALKRLRTAKLLMDKGERNPFFEESLRALWGYLGDKFAMPTSALSKQSVREEFLAHSLSYELADQFISLIEECELAQYAPAGEVSMEALYENSLSIIDKIE